MKKEWETSGWSQTLKLADGRIQLTVSKKGFTREESGFIGQFSANCKTAKTNDSAEEAKQAIITITKRRLKQALDELEAMEEKGLEEK